MSGEKLAALELEHRVAKAEAAVAEKDAEIAALKAELKEKDAALEFYGDENNWDDRIHY